MAYQQYPSWMNDYLMQPSPYSQVDPLEQYYAEQAVAPQLAQPSATQQLANTVGGIAGTAGGSYLGSSLFGSGSGAASAAIPVVPEVASIGSSIPSTFVPSYTTSLAPEAGLSTLGQVGSGLGGLAAMYGGTKMALDANKIGGGKGAGLGGLGGGLAGLGGVMGANALGFALGPAGIAAAIAAPLIIGALGGARLGDKDKWKTEGKRLSNLRNQGFTNLPELNLKKGRSKQELIDEALATGGNAKFAETRNEADLTPQDIVGYASIIEKAGKEADLNKRLELAKKALDAQAVREHHGTVDVDWAKVGV